jgi:hypothetical protein
MVQVGQGKNREPISKITRAKRAGLVECLLSKCKALSSNPSIEKNPKNKRK